ncbi:MAG: PTS sugar transporter subunit IIC [Oscillospiraceae bacterium]|nr:PTS sugar transporter subunit IIC [Candidatus Equicaccousia limihippi]
MKYIKKWCNRFFIDGLSGMALGLFSTLIIGTILEQLGKLIGGDVGPIIITCSGVAKVLTGAGIGVGVAYKFNEAPLTVVSAAVAGMIGAYAKQLLSFGVTTMVDGKAYFAFSGPGEPLGAFVAAYIGIEIAHLIAGKTGLDIILIPLVTIVFGGGIGLLLSPPIASFMTWLGSIINWATEQAPFTMGIVISVLMGMFLTLPISSAAIGVSLGLSGIAAGAAAIGCCCNMVGFAVISYKDNKFSGLISQGVGTSMLQMPNIVKKPLIWLPAIISSAVLGPVSTCLLKMVNNPAGSGMGTSGLVGQIMGYQAMVESGVSPLLTVIEILAMHIILPALLSFGIYIVMKKLGLIRDGDMKLNIL